MPSQRPYLVADAILDTLKAHGVSHIFGYPGGAILPFYDALPYHPEIKHILTRHEQGAAFMAQGWARTRKEIGVCCATSGPGATNLVTGIADAYMDSIPILAITGQVPVASLGKDAFQEIDMVGITMSITKHNYLADKPEDVVEIVTEAISIALSGRPGPVLIDIPKNIQASGHPRDFTIPDLDISEGNPNLQAYIEQDESVIEEVINTLNKASKPVLLLGQGVKHANAEELAMEFVKKTGLPTVTTMLAKGILPDDLPENLGILGMHGFYHCNMAVHEADVILNIGSRFDDRIVGRYDIFGKNAEIIHVDIDSSELNKVVAVDFPIHSDAGLFLEQMLKSKTLKKLNTENWKKRINKWRDDKPYKQVTGFFSMRNCLQAINKEIAKEPDKYIIVADVGQHQMWCMLSLTLQKSWQWLTSGGSATMGFSLPAAIGAAFANPDKTVICIVGDGSMQMNLQELAVIKDYNLNVKVMVMNNEYLGMVRQWQELFYENQYSQVGITSPDYKLLARAYSLPGFTIDSETQIPAVYKEIFSSPGPCIVEHRVAKEDNVIPMVPGGKHLGETMTE